MRMKYVSQIQLNIRKYGAIKTNKATSQILDGSYNSIYKGRSMNFDELREYVVGDDIKDIDWKASSRSQKTLVRQYIAEKKHNIMLVMDTNRRMLANMNDSLEKKEAAILSAGTLAYLVNQNGDYVSGIYNTGSMIKHYPFKTGLFNIENILENYSRAVNLDNHTNIDDVLAYIIRNFRRKMIIAIVTDLRGINSISETSLKRLKVMHDVLIINVADAGIFGKEVYNIENNTYLPSFFTKDKKLARKEQEQKLFLQKQGEHKLAKYGVSCITIDGSKDYDNCIVELLEKHKNEKRN